jgi:hypothetical protein
MAQHAARLPLIPRSRRSARRGGAKRAGTSRGSGADAARTRIRSRDRCLCGGELRLGGRIVSGCAIGHGGILEDEPRSDAGRDSSPM